MTAGRSLSRPSAPTVLARPVGEFAAVTTTAAVRQAFPPARLPDTFAGRGAGLGLVVSRLRRRSLGTPIRPLPAQRRLAHTSTSGE